MWSNKYLLVVTETLNVARVLKVFHKRDSAEDVGRIVIHPWGRDICCTGDDLEATWWRNGSRGNMPNFNVIPRRTKSLRKGTILWAVPCWSMHSWAHTTSLKEMQKENTWRAHHSDSFQPKSFKLEAAYQSTCQLALPSERSWRIKTPTRLVTHYIESLTDGRQHTPSQLTLWWKAGHEKESSKIS